jgi:hypothetical protein
VIVDAHAHYHPRAYAEALAKLPSRGASASGFAGGQQPVTDDDGHVQTRLEMMDEARVGLQVLSPRTNWRLSQPRQSGMI